MAIAKSRPCNYRGRVEPKRGPLAELLVRSRPLKLKDI